MGRTPALKSAQKKYVENTIARIEITVPKEQKPVIVAHAAAHGESVNGFVGRAIMEAMERDSAEQPNAETIAAMEELENGGGSTEELIHSLPEDESPSGTDSTEGE